MSDTESPALVRYEILCPRVGRIAQTGCTEAEVIEKARAWSRGSKPVGVACAGGKHRVFKIERVTEDRETEIMFTDRRTLGEPDTNDDTALLDYAESMTPGIRRMLRDMLGISAMVSGLAAADD